MSQLRQFVKKRKAQQQRGKKKKDKEKEKPAPAQAPMHKPAQAAETQSIEVRILLCKKQWHFLVREATKGIP